jgi:hypothetical protein
MQKPTETASAKYARNATGDLLLTSFMDLGLQPALHGSDVVF